MSKRVCPFTEVQQAVKKQEIYYGSKAREIRSTSSEKALQLLYLGAVKHLNLVTQKCNNDSLNTNTCMVCHKDIEDENKCAYCETLICCNCLEFCTRCQKDHCKNCVFVLEDKGYSICYSCY